MELTLFSIFPYVVLFLSLIATPMIYIKNSRSSTQNKNLPPGSLGLPFIGETISFLSLSRKGIPEKFICDRIARFSSQVFKTSLFGEPTVFFCGAEGNKFLFSNENKLVTPWWPKSIDKLSLLDDGSSADQVGKQTHTFIQRVFNPESFGKYIGIMDSVAERHFNSSWHGASQVQVLPLVKRYTFGAACSMFLNIDDQKEAEKLAIPFYAMVSGLFSIPIDFPGTPFHQAIKASKVIQKELIDIVKQRKIQLLENEGALPTTDLLSHIVMYQDENGHHLSDKRIAMSIVGTLVASHDTTSTAITFVIKYLAEFPRVYDEVFNEQMEILKSKAPGELLSWEDIQKMKYSWNVACEVMRLAPPLSPITFRQAIKDFNYDGFSIPKGYKILWSAHATHNNPEYFPEPEKFNPSRFNSKCLPFTFVPFGGGPRMCPGKETARLQILIFMHNIVKRFKWENLNREEKFVHKSPFPVPSNVLSIRLHPHKN